jgi:hypothetical protein
MIIQATREGVLVDSLTSLPKSKYYNGIRTNDIRRVIKGERVTAGGFQWVEIKDLTNKNKMTITHDHESKEYPENSFKIGDRFVLKGEIDIFTIEESEEKYQVKITWTDSGDRGTIYSIASVNGYINDGTWKLIK